MSSAETSPSIQYAETPAGLVVPKGWHRPSDLTLRYWRRSLELGVVPLHHDAHHTIAQAIPKGAIVSRATKRLAYNMRRTADAERADSHSLPGRAGLVGLAAPQIGVSRRVVLVDISKKTEPSSDQEAGELTVMINPTVTVHADSPLARIGHKCFSIPGTGAAYESPLHTTVDWYDERGKWHEQECVYFGSIVLDHEVNGHLDGGLFPDIAYEQGERLYAVPAELDDEFFGPIGRGLKPNLPYFPRRQWRAMHEGTFRTELFLPAGTGVSLEHGLDGILA